MKPASDIRVLMVAVEASLAPGLATIAVRRGWSMRQNVSVQEAFEMIGQYRGSVAILHVSLQLGKGLELIGLIRSCRLPVIVVAVADLHHDDIERAVRAAGVDCYLSGSTDADLVEDTIAELLRQRQRDVARQAHPGRRDKDDFNDLSPSYSSRRKWAVGYLPRRP